MPVNSASTSRSGPARALVWLPASWAPKADAPVLSLAITAHGLPLPKVHEIIDTRLIPKLAQVSGVGMVSLAGGQKPAVRVQVNPTAAAAYGLGLEDIRTGIANANVTQAKGSFDGPQRASTIDANDQLRSADDYGRLIVAWKNGSPIRLADVAGLKDDAENLRLAAWADRRDAVIVNVQRQPGANVIEVADRVRALIPQMTASLPASLDVRVLSDRTTTIRASVHDVQVELALAVALLASAGLLTMYSSGFDHGTRFVDHARNMLIAGFILFVVAQVPPQPISVQTCLALGETGGE